MKNIHIIGLTALVLVATFATGSEAGTCVIDGQNYLSSASEPVRTDNNGQFNGVLCGHEVYGTGSGGCIIDVRNDGTVNSYAECLYIGKGVELRGNGHTISCTASSCYAALDVRNSGGSGATTVDALNITGCWLDATLNSNGYGKSLTNTTINLAGSGCQGENGISDGWDALSRVLVENAGGRGIMATGTDISDSIVRNCELGIHLTSQTDLDNVVLHGNTDALTGYGRIMKGSHLYDNGCDCRLGASPYTCYTDMNQCIDGTSPPSFINDDLF